MMLNNGKKNVSGERCDVTLRTTFDLLDIKHLHFILLDICVKLVSPKLIELWLKMCLIHHSNHDLWPWPLNCDQSLPESKCTILPNLTTFPYSLAEMSRLQECGRRGVAVILTFDLWPLKSTRLLYESIEHLSPPALVSCCTQGLPSPVKVTVKADTPSRRCHRTLASLQTRPHVFLPEELGTRSFFNYLLLVIFIFFWAGKTAAQS